MNLVLVKSVLKVVAFPGNNSPVINKFNDWLDEIIVILNLFRITFVRIAFITIPVQWWFTCSSKTIMTFYWIKNELNLQNSPFVVCSMNNRSNFEEIFSKLGLAAHLIWKVLARFFLYLKKHLHQKLSGLMMCPASKLTTEICAANPIAAMWIRRSLTS